METIKINPEVLGAKLIDGVYYDRKTVKYIEISKINVTNYNSDKIKSKIDEVVDLSTKMQCVCV